MHLLGVGLVIPNVDRRAGVGHPRPHVERHVPGHRHGLEPVPARQLAQRRRNLMKRGHRAVAELEVLQPRAARERVPDHVAGGGPAAPDVQELQPPTPGCDGPEAQICDLAVGDPERAEVGEPDNAGEVGVRAGPETAS